MATDNDAELHYMELLNDIASGEKRAGIHLAAWADKTHDPELKSCLSLVADRETSHYHIFIRRISELGYSWKENDDPVFEERLSDRCNESLTIAALLGKEFGRSITVVIGTGG